MPWPPGAANDALGRLLAERLQEKFGVTAIVENRVGGAGLVGTKAVIQSDPDGYTFLASAFNTAVMPLVLKSADFNPETDLEVLARTAVAPLVCVISGKPAGEDARRGCRRRQGRAEEMEFRHLLARLGRTPGDDRVHPPHRREHRHGALSRHAARADRPDGRLGAAADRPELRAAAGGAGPTKVRALGIATKQRSVLAPDVPTMAEAGLPGFEFNSWYGVWAPKGIPADIATQGQRADAGDDARSRDRASG